MQECLLKKDIYSGCCTLELAAQRISGAFRMPKSFS